LPVPPRSRVPCELYTPKSSSRREHDARNNLSRLSWAKGAPTAVRSFRGSAICQDSEVSKAATRDRKASAAMRSARGDQPYVTINQPLHYPW